ADPRRDGVADGHRVRHVGRSEHDDPISAVPAATHAAFGALIVAPATSPREHEAFALGGGRLRTLELGREGRVRGPRRAVISLVLLAAFAWAMILSRAGTPGFRVLGASLFALFAALVIAFGLFERRRGRDPRTSLARLFGPEDHSARAAAR